MVFVWFIIDGLSSEFYIDEYSIEILLWAFMLKIRLHFFMELKEISFGLAGILMGLQWDRSMYKDIESIQIFTRSFSAYAYFFCQIYLHFVYFLGF